MTETALSTLGLLRVSLPRIEVGSYAHQSAVTFYDFEIEGISMRPLLGTENISVLVLGWNVEGVLEKLLLEEHAEPQLEGRIQLYCCRECGDMWCGGIAARIRRIDDRIRWESFERFWPNYERGGFDFETIRPNVYDFDYAQYRRVLQSFHA